MAFTSSYKQATPERDASLGLIFRLNNLWAKIDAPAERGDYDAWNNILDRIYCNLSYRDDITLKKDKYGEIQEIKLEDESEKIYKHLSKKIYYWRTIFLKTNPKQINKDKFPIKTMARNNWFHAVRIKDVWLRKHMMKLKLYLKESSDSPGTSLFGSFGANR